MGKRPTPKQRHPKSRTRNRFGSYIRSERRRLQNRALSPFARPARPGTSGKASGADEDVTTIKA